MDNSNISRFVYAAAHSFAWHAFQVADERYVVERETYRGIIDYKPYMAAKRSRALARRIFRDVEFLMFYLEPTNQLTRMAAYYRGLALHQHNDRLYQS